MAKGWEIALCLGLFTGLALWPGEMMERCRYALELCFKSIVPSLFPFFVLSGILSRLGLGALLGRYLAPLARRLYGVGGAGATALALGLTGGYPLGAAYIADLRRQGSVSREEGERLLAFCNNSGPAFIIGAMGAGALDSARAGLLLYGCHALSALICGLFFRRPVPEDEGPSPPVKEAIALSQALPEAVVQGVSSALNVCGFVVTFTVLVGIMDLGGLFSLVCGHLSRLLRLELGVLRSGLTGFFELGSAAGAMSGMAPTPMHLALGAGILGWGGLSVHFQTRSVLSGTDIKGALHLAGRLISASIAMVLAYVLGHFI